MFDIGELLKGINTSINGLHMDESGVHSLMSLDKPTQTSSPDVAPSHLFNMIQNPMPNAADTSNHIQMITSHNHGGGKHSEFVNKFLKKYAKPVSAPSLGPIIPAGLMNIGGERG